MTKSPFAAAPDPLNHEDHLERIRCPLYMQIRGARARGDGKMTGYGGYVTVAVTQIYGIDFCPKKTIRLSTSHRRSGT